MSLRQLWWDWNPKRLRRLMRLKDTQILANLNLANLYHLDMVAAQKSLDQAADEIERLRRTIRVLEYTLETKEENQ